MNKKGTISLILIAAFLMSMTGCSSLGAKGKIIKTTESYTQAVMEANTDDIAEFVLEGDDFSEELEEYLDIYTDRDHLQDIYDLILSSISCEIDTRSVSVNDNKATIDVTYTLIDFMDIYEDLRDSDDTDDFLEALEDNPDNTFDIRQKLMLRSDKGEWKIEDEDNEFILEVYDFYPRIANMVWAGSFPAISKGEFEDACDDFGLRYDDFSYGASTFLLSYSGSFYACLIIDSVEAGWCFDSYCDEYQEAASNGEYTGFATMSYNGSTGYMLFDIEATDDCVHEGHLYGGIFLVDDCIVIAYTDSRSASDEETVNDFLSRLGYPTP